MFTEILCEIARVIISAAIYGLALIVAGMWLTEFFIVATSRY